MRCTCTSCPTCQAQSSPSAMLVCAECGLCSRCAPFPHHAPGCKGCPGHRDTHEHNFLVKNGWKEVPSDTPGKTCWLAPPNPARTPLYFSLEAAYELETTGEGVWAYASKLALSEALHDEDLCCMDEQEAKRFAVSGVRLGIPPNY